MTWLLKIFYDQQGRIFTQLIKFIIVLFHTHYIHYQLNLNIIPLILTINLTQISFYNFKLVFYSRIINHTISSYYQH